MKHLLIILISLSFVTAKGQFYFNYTEAQIRKTFSQADKIDVLSDEKYNSIWVVLYSSVYTFVMDKTKHKCIAYMLREDNPNVLEQMINNYNTNYKVITIDSKWETTSNGKLILIEKHYNTSLNFVQFRYFQK